MLGFTVAAADFDQAPAGVEAVATRPAAAAATQTARRAGRRMRRRTRGIESLPRSGLPRVDRFLPRYPLNAPSGDGPCAPAAAQAAPAAATAGDSTACSGTAGGRMRSVTAAMTA